MLLLVRQSIRDLRVTGGRIPRRVRFGRGEFQIGRCGFVDARFPGEAPHELFERNLIFSAKNKGALNGHSGEETTPAGTAETLNEIAIRSRGPECG
jgi:hypothetical protein